MKPIPKSWLMKYQSWQIIRREYGIIEVNVMSYWNLQQYNAGLYD